MPRPTNSSAKTDEGSSSRRSVARDKPTTVEAYLQQVPPVAQAQFGALRAIAQEELATFVEALSYGVIGYRPAAGKRAVAFVGAFADHVAVYPVPDPSLLPDAQRAALARYQRGKGTLWFPLNAELPHELIRVVLRTLASAG